MTAAVRWGFLGAGAIAAGALAPAVHAAAGAELLAVAARDLDRATRLGAPRSYPSYAELLADPDVEAVYISLTNEAHEPWSVAALQAGKHVLCEKPLTLTAASVDAMAGAAQVAGRLLVEAAWYRWHPRVRLAERLIGTGAIGPVRHVAAGFGFSGVPAGNYRLDPARGGGALYDVGCYAVSAVLWAFGGASPSEVSARLRYGETGVDLAADLLLGFACGTAEVHAGMAEPERQWLVVTGEQGELELRDRPFTAWHQHDTELWLSTGAETRRIAIPAVDAYQVMVEAVSARIRGDHRAYVVPLDESRATAAVLDAAFAAAGGPPG